MDSRVGLLDLIKEDVAQAFGLRRGGTRISFGLLCPLRLCTLL